MKELAQTNLKGRTSRPVIVTDLGTTFNDLVIPT